MKRTIVCYHFFFAAGGVRLFFYFAAIWSTNAEIFQNKNAFPLKPSKAFIRTLIDDLRKEAGK